MRPPKHQLHQDQGAPTIELQAGIRNAPDLDKSMTAVKSERTSIAAVDAGNQAAHTRGVRLLDQCVEQCSGHTGSARPLRHINAVLDRESVTARRTKRRIASKTEA